MKIREIIVESKKILAEAVGRDLQHVEDIIYIEGPNAALDVVKRLAELGQDSKTMSIKWDGSPAIKFGRDTQGRFHYGDKHTKEMNLSPEDISAQIMNRAYKGKGEPAVDQERQKFAAAQSAIWKLYEQATPRDFRGFVTGDLMWSAPPQVSKNEFIIAPNTVKYFIRTDSELGQRMKTSKTGVALHFYAETFDSTSTPISADIIHKLGSSSVVILGPKTAIEAQAKVNSKELQSLAANIKKSASVITQYLAPAAGLKTIAADIYTYTNSNADVLTSQHFMEWAATKFTASKIANIQAKGTAGLDAIFNIMQQFMKVKVDVINQLEGPALGGLGIHAAMKTTGDQGGEGLVDSGSDRPLKFVNRATFSKANKIR